MVRRLRAKQWMAVLSGLGFSFIYGIASPQAEGLISLGSVKSAYEAGGQDQSVAIALSDGLMMGYVVTNGAVESRGGDPIFCPPDKLVLNGELLYRQTLSWSDGQQSRIDMFYAVSALLALEEAPPAIRETRFA